MYMYICMYACMYMCMCICICICICMYVCICICIFVYVEAPTISLFERCAWIQIKSNLSIEERTCQAECA